MKPLIVYSRHDLSRNWYSDHAVAPFKLLDWYDIEARSNAVEEYGDLQIGLFPTVFIWSDSWVDYSLGLQERVDVPAQCVPVIEPTNWIDVEYAIADYADRAQRGWCRSGVPPEGTLIWTDPPEVQDGQVAVHDGWLETSDGWVRLWGIKELGE